MQRLLSAPKKYRKLIESERATLVDTLLDYRINVASYMQALTKYRKFDSVQYEYSVGLVERASATIRRAESTLNSLDIEDGFIDRQAELELTSACGAMAPSQTPSVTSSLARIKAVKKWPKKRSSDRQKGLLERLEHEKEKIV